MDGEFLRIYDRQTFYTVIGFFAILIYDFIEVLWFFEEKLRLAFFVIIISSNDNFNGLLDYFYMEINWLKYTIITDKEVCHHHKFGQMMKKGIDILCFMYFKLTYILTFWLVWFWTAVISDLVSDILTHYY